MYLSISRLDILFFVSKTATNICSHDDILNSSSIIQKDESKNKKRALISYFNLSKWESEWLLFNANSAIFQLYHGENKLMFND